MIPSKLLFTVATVLEAATALGGADTTICEMEKALRKAQADLRTELEAIDSAPDSATRLAAMERWNEAALWAEMLVNGLSDRLNQTIQA